MSDDDLNALWALVQHDVGNRGVAGLFAATADDFAPACRELAVCDGTVGIATGFPILTAGGTFSETDGPLGALFLARTLLHFDWRVGLHTSGTGRNAIAAGAQAMQLKRLDDRSFMMYCDAFIVIELSGPAKDGRHYSMRGRDITAAVDKSIDKSVEWFNPKANRLTIGIGDGGNEVGMGKLPAEVIAACIPNGEKIACTIPTDYLLAAGVSNWGAYALAVGVAGVFGQRLPAEWFDPDQHREWLRTMVVAGPLVDGVTGAGTVTVDNVPWAEYAAVLVAIGGWAQQQGLIQE